MYYLAHLALPAIVVLAMAATGSPFEWSVSWFERAAEHFAYSYMAFASPHWVWAAASGYFDASKGATVGGFLGAHFLLFSVWLLVALSSAPEAANGWFIYFLGSPIAIAIGALAGRYVASWKTHQSA